VACRGGGEMDTSVLVGKHEEKRLLGRTPYRCTENVKLGFNETEWENVGGIHPASVSGC
jgi:hypothetical protein